MEIKKICLYGAGLIGAGWATCLLSHGVTELTIFDISEGSLRNCKEMIAQNFRLLSSEGILSADDAAELIAQIRFTTDIASAVSDCDLVMENGPENLALKQDMIRQIEQHCPDEAVIASSSSGLMANDIAAYARRPQRILGAHPYHPVYLLPLIEIVKNDYLEDTYLRAAVAFYTAVGKKPVVLRKDSPGYIASHLMTVLLRESLAMVINGVCTMSDIDDAFTYGPGLRYSLMGIFMTLQLAGGSGGIKNVLCGPMGISAEQWLASFADWKTWPEEIKDYFQNGMEREMHGIMERRDARHGCTNEEIQQYRDRGLLKLLKYHGLYSTEEGAAHED